MTRIQFLWLVVSLVLLHSVLGKQTCDWKDVECLTRGAKTIYKSLVAGTKTKPIDPLHEGKIIGELEDMKFEFINTTLSGLKNCEVLMLKCDSVKMTYEFNLQCPELIFEYSYVAKGELNSKSLDGKGLESLTIDDYLIIIQGNYNNLMSEKDQKPHLTIKHNNVETDLKGKLIFKSKHLISGNQEKVDFANAYYNDNYKVIEKSFRSQILEKFIVLLIKDINIYLETAPIDKVFQRD